MHGNVRLSQCRIFFQKAKLGPFGRTQKLDGFQSKADSHKQSDLDQHLLQLKIFHLKIGTNSNGAYYYFYTDQKEKSIPTLSLNKGSLVHIKISHNFEDKKSTQNVSTYSKRSKRGEEQFYKPATHLNVPQRGSASADPCG